MKNLKKQFKVKSNKFYEIFKELAVAASYALKQ